MVTEIRNATRILNTSISRITSPEITSDSCVQQEKAFAKVIYFFIQIPRFGTLAIIFSWHAPPATNQFLNFAFSDVQQQHAEQITVRLLQASG